MANRVVLLGYSRWETFRVYRTANSAKVPIHAGGVVEPQSVARVDAHKRGCLESQELSWKQLRLEDMDVRPKHTWSRDVSTVHRLLGSNTNYCRNQVDSRETRPRRTGLGDSLAQGA